MTTRDAPNSTPTRHLLCNGDHGTHNHQAQAHAPVRGTARGGRRRADRASGPRQGGSRRRGAGAPGRPRRAARGRARHGQQRRRRAHRGLQRRGGRARSRHPLHDPRQCQAHLEPPLRLPCHRRGAPRRPHERPAGSQEPLRPRRERARTRLEPARRPGLQADAVRAAGALRGGHGGGRGRRRRGDRQAGRPRRLLLRPQGGLGRGAARAGGHEPRQGRHAERRRQLRRGGAPQGRAAQRHGAHDDAGERTQARARRTSTR